MTTGYRKYFRTFLAGLLVFGGVVLFIVLPTAQAGASGFESINLVKTANSAAYESAGDTLSYNYAITNAGDDTLTNITVNDNKIPTADISCPSSSLAAGADENCTGTYTVTQADVDNGYVGNAAIGIGTAPDDETVTSAPSFVIVYVTPNVNLTLTPSVSSWSSAGPTCISGPSNANPVTPCYDTAGDALTYQYVATNNGSDTLTGVGVTDSLQSLPNGSNPGATPEGTITCVSLANPAVSCSGSTTNLAPGQSATFTGTYTVDQQDVDNQLLTDSAQASGTWGGTTYYVNANDSPSGPGNNTTAPGGSSSVTVLVAPRATPTYVDISNIPTSAYFGGSFTPTVSTDGDGMTSVTSSTTGVCGVNPDGSVSYAGVGTCTLTAHVAEGTYYAAADGLPQSFTVLGFTITTASLPPARPGFAYGPVSLQEAGAGTSTSPYVTTLKWKKITLPKGTKLSSAGVLSGTPNKHLAAGQSSVTVQVTETVTTLNGTKKVKTKTTVQATIPLTIN